MVNKFEVFYSFFVLPMIVSANYYYPVKGLKGIAHKLYEFWHSIESGVMRFLWKFYQPVDRVERAYFRLKNLCVMFNQICFFMICDNVLVPGQKVTCLYTLMFYNVLAYCVAYIKELVEKEDWSPYVHITDRSNIRHLAMSATKIVLEWTKAVTFIITIVFMLLVFGLETGLENYKPSVSYTIVTFLYYLLTEKVFVEMLTMLINYSQIAVLENMESLWLPVLFQLATAGASSLLLVPLIVWGPYRPALVGLYVNVYLRLKDSYTSNLKELTTERALIAPYRFATPEELGSFDDVCAVCLNPMKLARITPCHHIFHGDCLRKWVKTSNHCPLCKRELKFD
uniref:Protein TRC8 n=1 Tax=Lygus hesperus TaxID=30085 RepID=A0A0A9XQN7_LYGHE